MANHKSSKKRILRNAKFADINNIRRTRIRTFLKKVDHALDAGDAQGAEAALKAAQPELFRGVSKGIFKKNTASRKMQRLSARIKSLKAA